MPSTGHVTAGTQSDRRHSSSCQLPLGRAPETSPRQCRAPGPPSSSQVCVHTRHMPRAHHTQTRTSPTVHTTHTILHTPHTANLIHKEQCTHTHTHMNIPTEEKESRKCFGPVPIVKKFFHSSWILRCSSGTTKAQAGQAICPSSQSRDVTEGCLSLRPPTPGFVATPLAS